MNDDELLKLTAMAVLALIFGLLLFAAHNDHPILVTATTC